MKRFFLIAACIVLAVSCNKEQAKVYEKPLATPTKVRFEQIGYTTDILLSWHSNSTDEESFSIWNGKTKVDTVAPGDTQYVYSGLEGGKNYSIGVRADSKDSLLHSAIKYADVSVRDFSKIPFPTLSSLESFPTCLSAVYEFKKIQYAVKDSWGLCWSSEHANPTIDDFHAHGPMVLRDETPIRHVIPNVTLEYGKEYHVRAYVVVGGEAFYSNELTATLGTEPAGITFNWQEVQLAGLHEDIKVYHTSDELNGRPFKAWYAIADITRGNIEWRVLMPSRSATVDDQFAGAQGCQVLTNGAYFNMSSGANLGFSSFQGNQTGSVEAAAGTLASGFTESYSYYYVNKGCFGVDAQGVPSVYWVGTGNGINYFYTSPMASVKGSDKYSSCTADYPIPAAEWNPYYAITAGPVLVKNGKCVFDKTLTQKTVNSKDEFFLTNYEMTAYDIFSTTLSPDRTAVGYTADGKVILFVCDGRINESDGATIFELASIMKGLGCTDAVNFDGGGSTAMVAMGQRLNSLVSDKQGSIENRRVASTMGFFRK